MCDVCKSEKIDYQLKCGKQNRLYVNKFHCVYKNSIATAKLCYIHDIEFFHIGERRFLLAHLPFAKELKSRAD